MAGFHDWTIKGTHLCMTRLNLLRLNTMPALDPARLERVADLESLDNAQLRSLGRLPYPMLREAGDAGFRRISWDAANALMAGKIRATTPDRLAFFLTARGVTNEVYYVAQKAARALGTSHVDNAARICHAPSTAAMIGMLDVAATTCSYKDWWGTDLIIFFGSNPANDQPVATKYLHEAKRTGGLHAAALFDADGNLLDLREDVGRHNAVDKVLGAQWLKRRWPMDRAILLVSGRTSFEILQKSLVARVPIVAAVSAPSSLAVDFAARSGQTLVGFLRGEGMNLYTHPQRVQWDHNTTGE